MVQDTAADASLPAATRSDAVIPTTPAVTTTTTPLPPTTSPPPPDSSATSTNDHPAIRPASPEARPDERHENKERIVREGDDRDRQSRELRAGLHPLQLVTGIHDEGDGLILREQQCEGGGQYMLLLKHRFVFWYTRRTPGIRSQTSYEDNMKKISDFSTVEGFWGCYCHLARPSTLPNPTDIHLFKEGIRPLWEDAANRSGGKWIIRLKKVVSGRFWEDLVMAMIGDQLDYGDTVCGAVLSIRFGEDILSVWNRNSSDNQAVMALRDSIKRHLHLPGGYLMEYKPHDVSLRDNSSFRNTWIRG